MQITAQIQRTAAEHTYEVGDEVVVRLDGSEPREITSGATLAPAPTWTIAEITGKVLRDHGQPGYALRFRHRSATYSCVVTEDAIDGTA